MDRIGLKERAKSQIKGNIMTLFLIYVVYIAIYMVISLVPIVGGVAAGLIISPAFELGLIMIYIGMICGKKPQVGDVFNGFYDMWSAFKVYFFIGLFSGLWALLFVIPGVIKAYSYSMAPYILAENKGMGALEAIKKSQEMTNGHKMDLFVLDLSFIGWHLLGCVTFGIAYIWVLPYISATMANYYNEMKGTENFVDAEIVEETPPTEEPTIPEITE